MSTTGICSDFGDLTVAGNHGCRSFKSNTCCMMGGSAGSVKQDVIIILTIASTGDSDDFGDLTYWWK